MLETVRQYAMEKLDASGDGDPVRERHLDYYLALVEKADTGLGARGRSPLAGARRPCAREHPCRPRLVAAGCRTRASAATGWCSRCSHHWFARGHARARAPACRSTPSPTVLTSRPARARSRAVGRRADLRADGPLRRGAAAAGGEPRASRGRSAIVDGGPCAERRSRCRSLGQGDVRGAADSARGRWRSHVKWVTSAASRWRRTRWRRSTGCEGRSRREPSALPGGAGGEPRLGDRDMECIVLLNLAMVADRTRRRRTRRRPAAPGHWRSAGDGVPPGDAERCSRSPQAWRPRAATGSARRAFGVAEHTCRKRNTTGTRRTTRSSSSWIAKTRAELGDARFAAAEAGGRSAEFAAELAATDEWLGAPDRG